jgi:hypothetical protein
LLLLLPPAFFLPFQQLHVVRLRHQRPLVISREKITEIDTKCGDKDATVQVVVWDTKIASSKVSIAELGNVRLTGNGMAITLAFVAKDVDVPQPVTVTDLDLLITG